MSQNIEKVYLKILPEIEKNNIGNIRKIIKDKYGFFWFGTQDGLYRFDSKELINYNTDHPKKYLISGSDITDLLIEGNDSVMWVSTSNGAIDKIDINTGSVIDHITSTANRLLENVIVTCLFECEEYIIIGTSKGIFKLAKKNNYISKCELTVSNFSLADLTVETIISTGERLILLCKDQGIILYNYKTGIAEQSIRSTSFKSKNHNNSIRFYSIAKISNNEWCIATSDGLKLLKQNNNKILTVLKYSSPVDGKSVFAIVKDNSNNLFFSSEKHLYKYNIDRKIYSLISATKHNNEIENLQDVYQIYFDNTNIWLGCQSGITYFDNKPSAFNTFFNSSNSKIKIGHSYFLFPVNDSILYSAAQSGLYKINQNNSQIQAVDETRVYDFMFKDPNNKIIVSNRNGLFILIGKSIKSIRNEYKEFKPYSDYRINSAIIINDECIAMGTENYMGILIWNYVQHKIENFHKKDDTNTLADNVINNLFFLEKDRFCILGDNSFSEFNYRSKTSTPLRFKKRDGSGWCNLFFDMCKYKNSYYVASYGNGVLKLDLNLSLKALISTQNGLTNNGVYKLLPWKDSLLFISTNSGLSVYNASDSSIKKYYKSDGLHSDIFEETSGNTYKDILYAGGTNGFTAIYPGHIRPNRIAPLVYFTKISIQSSDSKILDTANLTARLYYINSNALQINILFCGINYNNPERTTFAYHILEQGKEWIKLNDQNFITLIGLSPGTYHLQVKAANEDGIYSSPKEILLILLPKWYQTWWFKLTILLIVIFFIYSFYLYRISQIKKQHEIRKNIATDLHDDLGSTLNSVKVYTNLALTGINQDQYLQQIKDNLREATTGLRDMIWVLDDSLDTVYELINRLKQFAKPLALATSMEINIEAESEINSRKLITSEKRNLFLICKEAINNTVKYSGATTMSITINPIGKKIQVFVVDNGKGFAANEIKEGYGLKNMHYRAKQIRYGVIISSTPGNGTQICIKPI